MFYKSIKFRHANEFHITDIVSMLCAALNLELPPGNIGKPVLEALTGRE